MTDAHQTPKPFCTMYNTSRQLRDKAMVTHQQAAKGAAHARKTCSDIAELNLDGIFASLHKMVDIVGGKSRQPRSDAAASLLQAAE